MRDYQRLLLTLHEQEKIEFEEEFLFSGADYPARKLIKTRSKITLNSKGKLIVFYSPMHDHDKKWAQCENWRSWIQWPKLQAAA